MQTESNQYFNIKSFVQNLENKALTPKEMLNLVQEEIQRAENLKTNLVEQIEKQPDAVVQLTNEIDTYVYKLQEILTLVPAESIEKQTLTTAEIHVLRDRLGQVIREIT